MRRYCLLLVAIFCASLVAQEPNDEATKTDTPQQVDIRSPALDGIQNAVQTLADNSALKDDTKQREEDVAFTTRDVDAQEIMAKYTQRLYNVTAFGVIVSIVTVVFLAANYLQTKVALVAANTANNIMQETAKRQLRAYIYVEVDVESVEGKKFRKTGKLILRNTGQIPAKITGVSLTVKDDVIRGQPPSMEIDPLTPEGFYIHGGRQTTYSNFPYTDTMEMEINGEKQCVYFWGVVHYLDGMGDARHTKFRFNTEYWGGKSFIYTCKEGNEST